MNELHFLLLCAAISAGANLLTAVAILVGVGAIKELLRPLRHAAGTEETAQIPAAVWGQLLATAQEPTPAGSTGDLLDKLLAGLGEEGQGHVP